MAADAVERGARFRLARKVRVRPDAPSGKLALLAPESLLLLNESGAAIVDLIDGQRSVAEIAAALAARFAADVNAVVRDVERLMAQLHQRRLVELVPSDASEVGDG